MTEPFYPHIALPTTLPSRKEEIAADLLNKLSRLLLYYRASIYFQDRPGVLWIAGKEYGTIDHEQDGCGHTFVVTKATK